MVAKNKTKLSHRQRFIKFLLLPAVILALVLFSAIQLMRISQLESGQTYISMQGFLNQVNATYNPLVIDGPQKLAYIPELSLMMPYDTQIAGTVRYMADVQDSASSSGVVDISTMSELQKSDLIQGQLEWSGCRYAFTLVVGSTDFEDKDSALLSKIDLRDGRTLSLYKSTLQACGAFTSSADGGTLIDMLQRTQSY